MLVPVLLIAVGFMLLINGADFLVDGSSNIAKRFHIPEIIIGLTIVSIGTSMPELFVSVTSALEGYSDMSLGNVIGSNLCNLLLILGLSTVIKPIKFQRQTRLIEIPMCLAITILFTIFCNTEGTITRLEAGILIALFVAFIAYTIYMGIKGEKLNKKEEMSESAEGNSRKVSSFLKDIFLVVIGIAALKIGGDLTVDNALIVARHFSISEKIIGLTIVALGTSLPELVTSVMAAIKGNSDIAIGNIIGSNIFNILLIVGVASLIKPITYNYTYNMQLSILVLSTIVLLVFPMIPPRNRMSKANGSVYLAMYMAYLFILLKV